MKELGDKLVYPEDGVAPHRLGWVHDIFDRNPERDDAQCDGEVDQERDQPVFGFAKLDETEYPPAVGAQRASVSLLSVRTGNVLSKTLRLTQ